MPATALPTVTKCGTPCAKSWDKKWIAEVNRREAGVGRRICGARTYGGTPCTLPSDHDSGRCRHHGGFPLTGAPAGNRNAVIHDLYSRRLMICGTHCPAWKSCPLGGGASTPSGSQTGVWEPEGVEPKETELGTRVGGAGNGLGTVDAAQLEREAERESRAPSLSFPRRRESLAESGPTPSETMEGWRSSALQMSSVLATSSTQGDSRLRGNDKMWVHNESEDSDPHRRAAVATDPDASDKTTVSYGDFLMTLPASERPLCPYEQTEYDYVVTDLDERATANGSSPARHLIHHVALLSVMVSRASRALTMRPFTEKFEQTADHYHLAMEKPSAQLLAFEKLSRELRQWVRLFDRQHPPRPESAPAVPPRARNASCADIEGDECDDVEDADADDIASDGSGGLGSLKEYEQTWEIIGAQENVIANLYARLQKAADRGFVDESDDAPDVSPAPAAQNGGPAP